MHVDAALHGLDQPARDRQPQSRAGMASRQGAVDLGEALEQAAFKLRRHAHARVDHLDAQHAVGIGNAGPHPAKVSELDGVGHEIEEHLAQPHGVRLDAAGQVRLEAGVKIQSLARRLDPDQIQGLFHEFDQGEGLFVQVDLACLDAGEAQYVVDYGEQRLAAGVDAVDKGAGAGGHVRHSAQEPGEAQNAGQGRADLVAHIREKFGLGPCARLGLLAFAQQGRLAFFQLRPFGGDAHGEGEFARQLVEQLDLAGAETRRIAGIDDQHPLTAVRQIEGNRDAGTQALMARPLGPGREIRLKPKIAHHLGRALAQALAAGAATSGILFIPVQFKTVHIAGRFSGPGAELHQGLGVLGGVSDGGQGIDVVADQGVADLLIEVFDRLEVNQGRGGPGIGLQRPGQALGRIRGARLGQIGETADIGLALGHGRHVRQPRQGGQINQGYGRNRDGLVLRSLGPLA